MSENGIPDTDDPKKAVRYFLRAMGRMGPLEKKYEKQLQSLEKQQATLETLTQKPFVKETELRKMKDELASLERKITVNIQAKQLLDQTQQEQSHNPVPLQKKSTPPQTITRKKYKVKM